MLVHTDKYIHVCRRIGILTTEKMRKYPLRKANLAMILKAYAIIAKLPYEINHKRFKELPDDELYLTDRGWTWLLEVFNRHSLDYLKSTFHVIFMNATEEDVINEDYEMYSNFRGLTGVKQKAGTKQKAVLIRNVGRSKHEFPFETLREARAELLRLSRFYPLDEFELYRIRKNTKNNKVYHYRSKVPLVLESNNRGAHLRRGEV